MGSPELGFRRGDILAGRYELHRLLGKGGFGEVYLAYEVTEGRACALKTIRTEFLADVDSRRTFKNEALLWINLDAHPFIVTARWAEEISGRLFVEMDYVAPDAGGRVTLADRLLRPRGPISLEQTLTWAIQFCCGMEHANRHGLQCHRDIKPGNILITQDGTLRVSDFGLGLAAEAAAVARPPNAPERDARDFKFSISRHNGGAVCGTAGYIAPEVVLGRGADVRSDIYAFGLVIWQMASGSPVPPFHSPAARDIDAYIRDVFQQQLKSRVPQCGNRLQGIIEQCLMVESARRPPSFRSLQDNLEAELQRLGRIFSMPTSEEKTAGSWNSKGASLSELGRQREAIECFDRALAIAPRAAVVLTNKGVALRRAGALEEAIRCFSDAVAIHPSEAVYWTNKGGALHAAGRLKEAQECFSNALLLDQNDAKAWESKGLTLGALGSIDESIVCLRRAAELDPRDALTWHNLGVAHGLQGSHQEASYCYAKAIEIDPLNAAFWNSRGVTLYEMGQPSEAASCFSRAVEIDPKLPGAWNNMGLALRRLVLGQPATAEIVAIVKQSLASFTRAVELDPADAGAWLNKAITEGDFLGDPAAGAQSLRRYLDLARNVPSERDRVHKNEKVLSEWIAASTS